MKTRTGGMIGAVDLGMTVRAAPVEEALVTVELAPSHERRRMHEKQVVELSVALLAEERRLHREQLLVVRAVCSVAVQTALAHGRVLPDKRTPFLGVARVTHVVHGISLQKRSRAGAMGRVAVHARDLSLKEGHVGALPKLRPQSRVTREAGLARAVQPEQRARRCTGHGVVAVAASQVLPLVHGPLPMEERPCSVAFKAHRVHLFWSHLGTTSERYNTGAIERVLKVRGAWPVTGLAASRS